MYILLIIVHVFVSLVLILVILMQAGRGGGVSEMFGGSSTQTIFGTSAGKFLARATGTCAIVFIITSLALAVLSAGRSRSLMDSGGAQLMDVEKMKGASVGEGVQEAVDASAEEKRDVTTEKTQDVSQEDVMPAKDENVPIEPVSE